MFLNRNCRSKDGKDDDYGKIAENKRGVCRLDSGRARCVARAEPRPPWRVRESSDGGRTSVCAVDPWRVRESSDGGRTSVCAVAVVRGADNAGASCSGAFSTWGRSMTAKRRRGARPWRSSKRESPASNRLRCFRRSAPRTSTSPRRSLRPKSNRNPHKCSGDPLPFTNDLGPE